MEPVHAITVLTTIYVSATFAGSITAILINTPWHICCGLQQRLMDIPLPSAAKQDARWVLQLLLALLAVFSQ
jgi:hypothetical protein